MRYMYYNETVVLYQYRTIVFPLYLHIAHILDRHNGNGVNQKRKDALTLSGLNAVIAESPSRVGCAEEAIYEKPD